MPHGIDLFKPFHVIFILDYDAGARTDGILLRSCYIIEVFVKIRVHRKKSAARSYGFAQGNASSLVRICKEYAAVIGVAYLPYILDNVIKGLSCIVRASELYAGLDNVRRSICRKL
ncbi:hypothetical protein [uncultured Ruminococcus sp.]|uniref:hypothetical protein n=1 Tax=uncultured Ruminococcus sp. TaxID=165186 RepID=UPI0025D81108|nr:hypothetical protein [uncultured Ruminococcus sp.]